MANSFFKFKQFTIYQERAAMRVGTDGVLLGAWCRIGEAKRILDVGTGTGLIALMAAQRSAACIDAVELDFGAACDAALNAGLSPWSDRVTIYKADFGDWFGRYTRPRYDHILSNPPYFVQSLLPPDSRRERARHTGTLDYESLFEGAAALLLPGGRVSLISPADLEEHLTFVALLHGFYPARFTYVSGIAGRAPKRLLSEWGRARRPLQTHVMAIEQRGAGYTTDYVSLTRDFYLKM